MTTASEKIYGMKDAIYQLYTNEGRSKNYISELLGLNRKILTRIINEEWKLEQNKSIRRLKPSNLKFLKKNKQFIMSKIDQDWLLKDISEHLGVSVSYLSRTIIDNDEDLKKSYRDKLNRDKERANNRRAEMIKSSSLNYDYEKIEGETWKDILGYEDYQVSDFGRIRKYIHSNKAYILISLNKNSRSSYNYIKIGNKGLKVSRLVGFAFIDGWSEEKNTIEHKDNNRQNDHHSNLMWVSQSMNNKLAYKKGRPKVKAYQRNGKFKKIIVDNKYEFKTIVAFAKWAGVSESQAHRYISKETPYNKEIKFIY